MRLFPALLAASLLLPAAGCRFEVADNTPDDEAPPAVEQPNAPEAEELPAAAHAPPAFSDFALMQIDLSGDLREEHDALSQQRDLGDYTNFAAGVVTAGAGIAIGAAVVGPPSLVLSDTVHHGAITQPEAFVWQYDKTTVIEDTTFEATVTAAATWYGWEVDCVVSASGPDVSYTDVLWFDGDMSYSGVVGFWQLYAEAGAEVASYDYLLTEDGEYVAAVYGDAGVLTATVFGDSRLITGTNAAGETAAVGWDATTLEGFVVHPDYLGGAPGCWDGSLMNAACS